MVSFGLPLEFTQWIELTAPREGGGDIPSARHEA